MSPMVFAMVVDVVTDNVRNGLMSEILYADDLVLMSETMVGLREKFWNWKEAFESKGLIKYGTLQPLSVSWRFVWW